MSQYSCIFFSWSLLVMLCITQACAQTSPMIHYTMDDGLPSNNVYNVYRDSKGYLWFATDKGVARYNGISFTKYTMADGLTDNEVFFTKEDKQHRLWMITYNGKLCYYKNGQFYSEKNTPSLKISLKSPFSPNISINEDGSVTFCYAKIHTIVDVIGDEVKVYNCDSLVRKYNLELAYVKKVKDHFVLLGNSSKLIADKQMKVLHYEHYDQKYLLVFDNDANLYMLHNGNVYDSDRRYLYPQLFNYASNFVLRELDYLLKILPYPGGAFFCTRSGFYTTGSKKILENRIVTSAAIDVNGNYWVSLYRDGVYSFNAPQGSITRFDILKEIEGIHAHDDVLYYQSKEDYKIYSFYDGKQQIAFPEYSRGPVLKDLIIYDIYCVCKKKLFIFTAGLIGTKRTITIVDKGKMFQKHFPQIYHGYVNTFYANESVYFYNKNEIGKVRLDSIEHENYKSYETFKMSGDEIIVTGAMDGDDVLWVSTNKHLYKYVQQQLEVQSRFKKVLRRFLFCDNYLIGYDDENVLTVNNISTQSEKAIGRYEGNGRQWQEIYKISATQAIAVTDNLYYLITIDPASDLCVLSVLENPFVPLNARYIYADSSNCYFVKDGSITSVPLRDLKKVNKPPSLLFTQLKKDGAIIDIDTGGRFVFDKVRDLNIEYDYVSFGSKELSCQYAVSKEGESDNWNGIKGNSINLSSPGYGTYTIKLRARDEAGSYTSPVSITVTIQRPFWLSWWFITLLVTVTGILIFMITRSIILLVLRRRKRVYDLESKYYAAEYKTLNALMNPHFIFNSLNNIRGLMNRDDKKTATRFLNSFSNVVRQNMQNLSKETVSLQEELQLVSKYLELEQLRFGDIINYELKVDARVAVEEILIPPLLIQPLAENAVKHGLLPQKSTEGMIRVHVYELGTSLFIEVQDNGVGLYQSNYSEHEGYESLGLANIEKRLLYLRQSGRQQIYFTIRANPEGKGTIAAIEIRES